VDFKVRGDRRMIVPVYLNDSGPYQFLLDTGAAATVLEQKIGRELGLKPVAKVRLGTFIGEVAAPLAPVKRMTLGAESVENTWIICAELQRIYSFKYRIHGVLGQDFLSHFNVLIDYRSRKVWLSQTGALRNLLAGTPLPVQRRQSKYYLTVPAKPGSDLRLTLLLDSGACYPVLFMGSGVMAGLDVVRFGDPKHTAASTAGRRFLRPCLLGGFLHGEAGLRGVEVMLAELLTGETRFEDGLLPTYLFEAIYFDCQQNYVLLNPRLTDEIHQGSPPVTAPNREGIQTSPRSHGV